MAEYRVPVLDGLKIPPELLGGTGADNTKFLRGDQTWIKPGSINVYGGYIGKKTSENIFTYFAELIVNKFQHTQIEYVISGYADDVGEIKLFNFTTNSSIKLLAVTNIDKQIFIGLIELNDLIDGENIIELQARIISGATSIYIPAFQIRTTS